MSPALIMPSVAIQRPECRHRSEQLIEKTVSFFRRSRRFATCRSLSYQPDSLTSSHRNRSQPSTKPRQKQLITKILVAALASKQITDLWQQFKRKAELRQLQPLIRWARRATRMETNQKRLSFLKPLLSTQNQMRCCRTSIRNAFNICKTNQSRMLSRGSYLLMVHKPAQLAKGFSGYRQLNHHTFELG